MHSYNMKVLVVEDDEPKLRAIKRFFGENYKQYSIAEAKSLTSAIALLDSEPFSLAVVDMSLPTYDISAATMGGGAPQGFGGEDVLRFISAVCPDTLMLVITQYEEFPDSGAGGVRSLAEIGSSLAEDIGEGFLGAIHYSGQHGDWQIMMKDVIDRAIKG